MRKYGSARIWQVLTDLFDSLPLAAVIDNSLFCPHAGKTVTHLFTNITCMYFPTCVTQIFDLLCVIYTCTTLMCVAPSRTVTSTGHTGPGQRPAPL
jgi:hypothetical protein